MKEYPILFNGEMVQAILAGQKTQTRRVIEPQPKVNSLCLSPIDCQLVGITKDGTPAGNRRSVGAWLTCPYGIPGDKLWVRETWRLASINANIPYAQFWTVQFADFRCLPHPQPDRDLFLPLAKKDVFAEGLVGDKFGKWRPSIHMYKWMSRITLEVTNIRAERLNDISDNDAVAEGIKDLCHCGDYIDDHGFSSGHNPVSMPGWAIDNFSELWDSINGKSSYSWESNPWVWVIEFKRIKS